MDSASVLRTTRRRISTVVLIRVGSSPLAWLFGHTVLRCPPTGAVRELGRLGEPVEDRLRHFPESERAPTTIGRPSGSLGR